MQGKIIVVTGGPRTGKSTLVKLLSQKLQGKPFLEGEEEDFPKRILEDIALNKRILELIVWFRNKYVKDYLDALEIKRNGGTAVLDTFWLTNDVYIDEWVIDVFEKKILKDLIAVDCELLPWPDLVLSLYANKDKVREISIAGGRKYELNENFLKKQVDLNTAHEEYFRKINKPNIHFIDVSKSNYLREKDPKEIISFVRNNL